MAAVALAALTGVEVLEDVLATVIDVVDAVDSLGKSLSLREA